MRILFVGLAGTGKMNRACDARLVFFANLLARKHKIVLLNRYASKFQIKSYAAPLKETIIPIDIIRPINSNGIITKFLFFISIIIEVFVLIKINSKAKIDILHVYTGHYFDMLMYWIVAKIIHAKVVYQYVEYKSALPISSLNIYGKLNNYLVDNYGAKLWDGVIPISDFLQEKALEVNPKLICQKVIPLCDFKEIDRVDTGVAPDKKYILYCGSIGYVEVAEMIVSAFENSLLSRSTNLVMVLSGKDRDKITSFKESHPACTILTDLTYSDLISYYRHAIALLVPLRDNIRDKARFPNKICEYLASHGVIVTTDVGEINNYFEDGKNALVVPNYDEKSLSLCFDRVENGEYDMDLIRKEAYQTGLNFFNTDSYAEDIESFLHKLYAND